MIGLSTYAFFWQISDRAEAPLGLAELLVRTRELGGQVFQICDYLPIRAYSTTLLADLKKHADELGVVLELGTKGIKPELLADYLRMADLLGVKVVRSMVTAPDHRPSLAEAEVLRMFLDNPRRLISRAQMLETLGGTAGESFDRAMDVRISRLRTKLGEDPKNPRLIKTIYGAGYIFLAEIA